MKTFFTRFFLTLGVIFFFLLCAGAYLWFVDPFNLKPLLSLVTAQPAEQQQTVDDTTTNTSDANTNAALSPEQEAALQTIGINPATLPIRITSTQETCFAEKLGAARVAEIKAGAVPSAAEFYTARMCLNT